VFSSSSYISSFQLPKQSLQPSQQPKRSSSPSMDSFPTTILSISPTPSHLSFSRPPATMSMASTPSWDSLPARIGIFTTMALNLAINAEASCINCICAVTAWGALIQDYEACKAAEHGVKVFIKAVVKKTWIRYLCIPRRSTPTLQPSPSLTIFASVPAAYMRWI
jgi:hypothetical protein